MSWMVLVSMPKGSEMFDAMPYVYQNWISSLNEFYLQE